MQIQMQRQQQARMEYENRQQRIDQQQRLERKFGFNGSNKQTLKK